VRRESIDPEVVLPDTGVFIELFQRAPERISKFRKIRSGEHSSPPLSRGYAPNPTAGVILRCFVVAGTEEPPPWQFRLSVVVLAELLRGSEGRAEQRFIAALARHYRAIEPSLGQWIRCGEVMRRLRKERSFDARGLRAIQNDVLIGLTARGRGLPVLTTNPRDFRLIAEFVRGLVVIEFFDGTAKTGVP
jgi:predicted nucleic acid-binding protein